MDREIRANKLDLFASNKDAMEVAKTGGILKKKTASLDEKPNQAIQSKENPSSMFGDMSLSKNTQKLLSKY